MATSHDGAFIEIWDHGVGMPEHQIKQLLELFARLHSARGQANGAGMGLTIVERGLSRHNAELTVSNCAGGGLFSAVSRKN